MNNRVKRLVTALKDKMIERRRDFHRHPEVAWTEFRTAAIVAYTLTSLGYKVETGNEVIIPEAMMGVPDPQELKRHAERALQEGAEPAWVEKMSGGKTGVVGTMKFARSGPVVALRFDMDANDAIESEEETHRPRRENFASIHKGAMHACGHDAHTAIGLAVAEVLAELKNDLAGTIKLIFQPAEEGVRGAKAMVAKGIVDEVDYFIGMHIGFNTSKRGQLACNIDGFLATTKLDATFTGVPAHAGAAPEAGSNALLAAATAALNLHAIARHSEGASRINVGILQAGTGRNVIPANAVIKLETRGVTTKINDYMVDQTVRILKAAADMYGVGLEIKEMGGAAGAKNDAQLVERMQKAAQRLEIFDEILPYSYFGASEDCTYFMERVQQHGGKAAYIMVGTDLAAGHHDFRFDMNEDSLEDAAILLSSVAIELLQSVEG